MNEGDSARWAQLLLVVATCVLVVPPVLARDDSKERAVIAHVQSVPASKIEADLPNVPFKIWLKSVLGGAHLEWKLHGCSDDDDEDECKHHWVSVATPTWHCPSVAITLVVERRSKTALSGRQMYLLSGSVSDFGVRRGLKKLVDLAKTVKEVDANAAPHRPPSLPAYSLKKMTKEEIIGHVQALDVHSLDPSLPSERFDRWFYRTARWPLEWWLNDDLSEGYARCAPQRLQVRVYPADRRDPEGRRPPADVVVDIGSWERGIEGEPKLTVYFGGNNPVLRPTVENLHTLQTKLDEWTAARLAHKPEAKKPVVQNLTKMGNFSSVSQSANGDCAGHVLDLWKYGNRVFGLLREYSGLCGDPECGATQESKFDSKTGDFAFWSSLRGQEYRFAGKIEQGKIVGALNTRHEAFKRKRDGLSESDSDKNLTEWCASWGSHSGCSGVKDMCRSLGVHVVEKEPATENQKRCFNGEDFQSCHMALGDLQLAGKLTKELKEKFLARACELGSPPGCDHWANLLVWEKKDIESAIAVYSKNCEKGYVHSCESTGFHLKEMGRHEDARRYYLKSCSGDKQTLRGCRSLGQLSVAIDAKTLIEEECTKRQVWACYAVGFAAKEAGDKKGAKEAFMSGCTKSPSHQGLFCQEAFKFISLPPDAKNLFDWEESCAHWRGEPAYNAERAKQIEEGINRSCKDRSTERAALRKKYQGEGDILFVLDNLSRE